jgi:hypothetical protein
VQWILASVTFLAFVAAAIYAWEAHRQLHVMNDTYGEIRKQTTASQQSAYVACVNAQIARQALIQGQRSAISAEMEAMASTAQALAAGESERAYVEPIFVPPTNIPTNRPLQLVYEVKNDGKADARNIDVKSIAVMVPQNSTPVFTYKSRKAAEFSADLLKGGEMIPEQNPVGAYGPVTYTIYVRDELDSNIVYDQKTVDEIIRRHTSDIVIYGKVKYSDYRGNHWRHFCRRIAFMNFGEFQYTEKPTKDEERCVAYDKEGDWQAQQPLIKQPAIQSPPLPEVKCQIPEP